MRSRKGLRAACAVAFLAGATCATSGTGATRLVFVATEPSPGRIAVDGPATVPAGLVEVTLRNETAVPHEARLVRFDGAHGLDEVLDVLRNDGGPIPAWLHAEGGVAQVAPGTSNEATMVLPAGSYYVIGGDAGRSLTVTEGEASKALPEPDASVIAREYEFAVAGLRAGVHEVRFANAGAEPHVVIAVPIQPGATLDDVRRALADRVAAPPVDFGRGTGAQPLDAGKALVTRMTFVKGRYALACFLNDRAGGPPHFALGMVQEITVA